MSKEAITVAACVVALLLVAALTHCLTVAGEQASMPDQLALPMPLDDGTRDEIAVYTIETEVE